MGPFAGYEMPIVYTGIADEHRAVRSNVGIFDVSHMGRLRFRGDRGFEALRLLTTIDVTSVLVEHARYGMVLNDHAGIIDDVFLYTVAENDRILVVNASNRNTVLAHMEKLGIRSAAIDETDDTGMLAVQGPHTRDILKRVIPGADLPDFSNRIVSTRWEAFDLFVATTGYTGEDGCEIIAANPAIETLWDRFVEAGAVPAGLGARDTLRLEVAYPLHGHELSPEITPVQAGLTWAVAAKNEHYFGRDAYIAARSQSVPKLVGIRTRGRGVPRAEYSVVVDGAKIGRTTSGTFSPSLKAGIALAYVDPASATPGTTVSIVSDSAPNRPMEAEIVDLPFYREGSRRPSRKSGI